VKRLLPLFIAATFAASTDAQVSIGNRLGLSISHQESSDALAKDSLEKDQNTLLGMSTALCLEVKVKPFIAVQAEFGLTQKGHQIKEEKQPGYQRTRLLYADAAILAKGIIGKGPTKLNVLAGASFGRGMVGIHRTYQQDTLVDVQNSAASIIDFDKDNDKVNPAEWSLIGGLGASFDLGRSRVFVEGRYVSGLTSYTSDKKQADGSTLAEITNRSILIQFGYLVQLNDPKNDKPVKPETPQY
jgi:hypothetical protein